MLTDEQKTWIKSQLTISKVMFGIKTKMQAKGRVDFKLLNEAMDYWKDNQDTLERNIDRLFGIEKIVK